MEYDPFILCSYAPKTCCKIHKKQNEEYLNKRLLQWKEGRYEELMREGRVIQDRLSNSRKMGRKAKTNVDRMNELIENGKIGPAGRCICEEKTDLLEVDEAVFDILKEKHPEAAELMEGGMIQGPLPEKLCEDVTFEGINTKLLKR